MIETPQQAARRLAKHQLDSGYLGEALHVYRHADGSEAYIKIRARDPRTHDKWVRPMHKNGNGYELGEPAFPDGKKPLYNLHTLTAQAGSPVWYVEGEGCADALVEHGLIATTAGSATSEEHADFSPLAGRTVTIWPDNDKTGREHAQRVAAKLRTLGCTVEILDAAALGLADGGDVVDWLKEHPNASARDLAALPRLREVVAPAAAPTASSEVAEEPWPDELGAHAYHGLIGEIVKEIEPQTESDSAMVLAQALVAVGALIGRGPHRRVEGDQHHVNLFLLCVGESSKARKGSSWSRVREIFDGLHDWPQCQEGLSSGEGLKWAVRDPITKIERDEKNNAAKREVDPGVTDKRLLVVESEFSQVLRQCSRSGNTLSATIRTAWDGRRLSNLTKHDPVTATGAHVSIIGHITANELRAELTAADKANGFANRFLFVCARRSKLLPFGGDPITPSRLEYFRGRLARVAERARKLGALEMTESARQTWAAVYPTLSAGYPGLLGAVTARAEAHCTRLALLYALLDEADAIDNPHVLAALAIWERADASARYTFGSAVGDPVADTIVRALRAAGPTGMTRTEIRDLFKRHQSAERLEVALQLLQRLKLARCESRAGAGRSSEVWTCA